MIFYGTRGALLSWKAILENELLADCNDIIETDDRFNFSVDLSKDDRIFLMENFWYEVEPGYDLPWNCRVTFSE